MSAELLARQQQQGLAGKQAGRLAGRIKLDTVVVVVGVVVATQRVRLGAAVGVSAADSARSFVRVSAR